MSNQIEPRCPHCGFVLSIRELPSPGNIYLQDRGVYKQGECWSCGEVHGIMFDGTVERMPDYCTPLSNQLAQQERR